LLHLRSSGKGPIGAAVPGRHVHSKPGKELVNEKIDGTDRARWNGSCRLRAQREEHRRQFGSKHEQLFERLEQSVQQFQLGHQQPKQHKQQQLETSTAVTAERTWKGLSLMKKLMALIALAGMVVVGCAHKEKNMGGSSDQRTSSYSSDSSSTFDTNTYNLNNNLNNNPNSNITTNSNPQRQ
jgi:hypothetical protein